MIKQGSASSSASSEIFVTDFPFGELNEEKQMLEQSKISGKIRASRCDTPEEVMAKAADADALLVHHTPINAEVIKKLDNLKVIGRYGAGYDVIDVQAATAAGIPVINDPTYCVEEVSAHALALILTLNRRLFSLHKLVRENKWRGPEDFNSGGTIHRLRGQKLGIIGLGRIGQRLAEKARTLGLEILIWDRRAEEKLAENPELQQVETADFSEVFSRADIISVHLPLTAETSGLIGEKEFELMHKDSIFINTARGDIVREQTLVQALKAEKIAGAGLDVFKTEPLPDNHSLLNLPAEIEERVIMTPHAAFYSQEAKTELRDSIMHQVLSILTGEKPPHIVNPGVW